jgi:F0F1-type ATP synthase membrane subunit b/b'
MTTTRKKPTAAAIAKRAAEIAHDRATANAELRYEPLRQRLERFNAEVQAEADRILQADGDELTRLAEQQLTDHKH